MSHQRTLSSWTVSVMAFAFGGLIGCAAQAADLPVAGYRGDGSGVFPGSPPTSFDEKTGQNIRWKAPLPNWGHGSPIAIAGKVFVTCEGGWKCDFPELLCFDADPGKELWRAELNHLPATGLPPEQQAAIAKRWAEVMARYRLLNQLWNDWSHATDKQKAIEKFNQETGWTFAAPTSGGYLENCKATDRAAWGEFLKPLAAAHLTLDSWYHCHGDGLACIGQTYPTPVSDGKQVWAVTAFGGVFCYDLAGKEVWKAYFPGIGAGDYCSRGKSPILYKDLLISDVDGLVRGMDAATGKLRWKGETGGRNYHTIASPAVITTGGQDVLLCGGKDTSDGKVSLHAFRLPDGQPLTVDGWSNCGATMLVKSDERDVAFFTGGGEHGGWEKKGNGPNPPPSAIKFALDGTALKATVVWSAPPEKRVVSHTVMAYHEGKLYAGNFIFDAKTGAVVAGAAGRAATRVTPPSQHLLLIAGGHTYGLDGARRAKGDSGPAQGTLSVYTLDGKRVAESLLTNAPAEGEKREQARSQNGRDAWAFSYGYPFTIGGDRLYIRSHDFLWCIGAK